MSLIVGALTANPTLWAKTLFILTYDENGGFFDHVPPTTAPPGTPGEYVTAPAVPDPAGVGNPAINGPIGLGFRVPTLLISPFTRGGFVSSDLFDHTSILRFLETRFGAEVPNLSAWRRSTVGDLTSALNFKKPDQSIPNLPSTLPAVQQVIQQCVANLAGRPLTLCRRRKLFLLKRQGVPVVPAACVKGIAPESACGQTQAIANKREFATHLAQYIFDSAALQGYMD